MILTAVCRDYTSLSPPETKKQKNFGGPGVKHISHVSQSQCINRSE